MGTNLLERERLAKERVEKLRQNATVHEKIFLKMLKSAKIDFIFQKAFYNHSFFLIADFYLPEHKLCVELNGSQHYTPESIAKDTKRAEWLLSQGITVWHIVNRDVLKMNPNDIRLTLGLDTIKTRKKKRKSSKKPFKLKF